ncbi:MAG: cupin domain-containing protein [Dehalococcoidia bacterium]
MTDAEPMIAGPGLAAHDAATTIVPLDAPFVDDRGAIRPLVEADIRSVLIIESKAGAVRADHYHHSDWHYLYVISGQMIYWYRPHGDTSPPRRIMVEAGQLIFTPAMMEHRTDFPVDTVCVTLSRNQRDQAAYEADVVRIQMPVDETTR